MPISYSEITRSQQDVAAGAQVFNFLLPGPTGPEVAMLVCVSMRGVTNPSVSPMSWNGTLMHLIRHANNGDVAIEYWYIQNPSAGAAFNLNFITSVAMGYTIEIIKLTGFGRIGAQGDSIGAVAAVSTTIAPTRDSGVVIDMVNLTTLPAGYTLDPGQSFINFGTVGALAGLYEMSSRLSAVGSTTMDGTIVGVPSAWVHMAIEFLPPQIQTLEIAGAGLYSQHRPFRMAGTGWMDNLRLELPTQIGAFVVYSNPILVAGFNSFLLVVEVDINAADWAVFHCDPLTYQVVGDPMPLDTSPILTPSAIGFGAFSATVGTDTTGMDWYVIRIGCVTAPPPEATLLYAQLLGGKR